MNSTIALFLFTKRTLEPTQLTSIAHSQQNIHKKSTRKPQGKYQQAVLKIMPSAWKKVECLEIPDIYYREQPELRQLIVEKMKPFTVH
jgi:predicted protein tyrosine phosphatase